MSIPLTNDELHAALREHVDIPEIGDADITASAWGVQYTVDAPERQVTATFNREGKLSCIYDIVQADHAAARAADECHEFPRGELEFRDGAFHRGDRPVPHRNYDVKTQPALRGCRWIDTPDPAAFVLVHADGVCQLAVVREHEVALGRFYRFDEPCLAWRARGNDIEVYREAGETESRLVYASGPRPPTTGVSKHSGWVPLRTAEDRARVVALAEYAREHVFSTLEQELTWLSEECDRCYAAGRHGEAIRVAERYLEMPHAEEGQVTPCGTYQGVTVMRYKMVCNHAKLMEVDRALELLLEIEPKWQHWRIIFGDPDFASLNELAGYQELRARHPQ
jgi:hypothetical protein